MAYTTHITEINPNQYKRWVNRFDSMFTVEPYSGCWLWLGSVNRDGYGHFNIWDRNNHRATCEMAHRLSYRKYKGEIPKGMKILHSCDTPLCVNPNHLRIGSDMDNKRDSIARDRHVRRERHPMAKMNADKVRWVRINWRNKTKNQHQMARELGMDPSTIWSIANGKSWKNIC